MDTLSYLRKPKGAADMGRYGAEKLPPLLPEVQPRKSGCSKGAGLIGKAANVINRDLEKGLP